MQNVSLADGVSFLALKDDRFKTVHLTVGAFLPLSEETAAAYAILPELLTHATKNEPNIIALHRRLSRLYGASVNSGVQRLGDHQVLSLSVSCIQNRFALNGEDVVLACAQLLTEMLFSPHLSADGLFDAADVQQEKRCLLERIAAIVNDKRAYARMRGDALLADGEPYGVAVCGTQKTAEAITRERVTAAWQTVLKTAVFQWIYVGPDDGEKVAACIKDVFKDRERAPFAGQTRTDFKAPSTPRTDSEYMAVGQAKLSMGFRLAAHEPNVTAVMTGRLLSALFGGSPTSLLFRNVREKMSLCYYCSSGFERIKGVLTVDSGVDVANVERAKAEILNQLETIKNGAFSDEDLEYARLYLINQIKDGENQTGAISGWYMGQALCPPFRDVAQTVALIQKVTKEDIVALAKTVTLVSTFALLPKEENV